MSLTLDKEARFAECHTKHSAKYLTWGPLWWILCRVLLSRHSAKTLSPSLGAVTAAFLCRVPPGTRQTYLPSAREKVLGKEGFADALCAECDTRQSRCRLFLRLCRVLQALSKAIDSGSARARG
jgi:hypothetical protein